MKVFKESHLNDCFTTLGYVKISLLDNQQISKLNEFYLNNKPDVLGQFHTTHFYKDVNYKTKVQTEIEKQISEKLHAMLIDFKPLFSNFMVKEPGDFSRMPLHADWTYVDETTHCSLGVWCTLVDTNETNGMLGVVPYSHNLKTNFRGPNIPSPFHDYNEYIIDNFGKLLPMNAGEAVIYNHRLLHFSPPNKSNSTRLAFNSVWVPDQVQIVHYANMGNYPMINKYLVNEKAFYLNYVHFQEPEFKGRSKQIDGTVESFSENYIKNKLQHKKWWQKLWG